MKSNSLYDIEYFQKIRASHENKKKRAQRRRIVLIALAVLLLIYIITPLSRINNVDISGNALYSNEQIQKKANIYNKQFSLLHPSFLIKSKLENTELFEKVSVKKHFLGNVDITVEENKLLFYQTDKNKTYFYDSNGNKLTFNENNTKLYKGQVAELASSVNDEIKDKIIDNLSKLDESVLNSISQILYKPKSYDKEYFRFIMNGNKKVYINSSLDDIVKVGKNYHNFVSNTKFNCSIIEFLDTENRAIVKKCK